MARRGDGAMGVLDKVKLSTEQIMSLHEMWISESEQLQLLLNPSVRDVELILGADEKYRITFVGVDDGILEPVDNGNPIFFVEIACKEQSGYEELISYIIYEKNGETFHTLNRANEEFSKLSKEERTEPLEHQLYTYVAVQKTLIDSPKVFLTTTKRKKATIGANCKRSNKRKNNKVIAYRVLTIVDDEFEKLQKPKQSHQIQCPAWGVRGHYRHYESGKVVFVPQYVKGKDKTKYQGKEYVLFPKEVNAD